MTKEAIIQSIAAALEANGCFLVEVSISADNDIEIVIEKETGDVDWDNCAAIDKAVHEVFDQDVEDYSLMVSSAGLDRPFKVQGQFLKAIGTTVDVKFKGGRRLIGILREASAESISIEYEAKEAVPGKKKKETVHHLDTFSLADINSVSPYIDFK